MAQAIIATPEIEIAKMQAWLEKNGNRRLTV